MPDIKGLYDSILNGDRDSAVEITRAALAEQAAPMDLVNGAMIPAMDEVGRLFSAEEYFVPELLLAGRAMKAALELIRPLLAAQGIKPVAKVVIGTVQGDLHDIGKNIVASVLEGGGFEVIDLGVDVAPPKFVDAIRKNDADIVALSALLTVTMPSMKAAVDAISAAGLRETVRVIVGGAPVTKQYADEIGADGYAQDAAAAVPLARGLMRKP